MAAVVRTRVQVAVATPDGVLQFSYDDAIAVTEWVGPINTQVATGTTEQSVVALLTQGLTTITMLAIKADQDISVTYGSAGSNAPVTLSANKFHVMHGTSITDLAISNSSGATANVAYFVAGS